MRLVRDLGEQQAAADALEARDALQQRLERARAGLARIRAEVDRNAQAWQLRSAKTTLRSYREVARASRAS